MAYLTDAEKDLFKEQGLYGLKEKCDSCGGPILECSYILKDNRVVCPKCHKGVDYVQANKKEEDAMASKKAVSKADKQEKTESTKLFGVIRQGTALADLANYLHDGKVRKIKDALAAISPKHKVDKMARLRRLARWGRKSQQWAVKIDEEAETVQLIVGEKAAEKLEESRKKEEKPTAKKAKPKAKANGKADDEDDAEPATSKQQRNVQKLIRRVLKSKDDLTENKLVELLKEDHSLDGKRVQAALQAEIKAGGVTKEKGVLALA